MLKRDLSTDHGLTPQEYRARWNLSADHALAAPDYAPKRAELAKSIGFNRKRGGKVVDKDGRKKLKVSIAILRL